MLDTVSPSSVWPSSKDGGIERSGNTHGRQTPAQGATKPRSTYPISPQRAVEVVDAHTLTTHLLTLDALAARRLPEGRYTALCGKDVLPACLTEPGSNRCSSCISCSSIPSQRRGWHEGEL
jgi:hypothetical protein